MTDTIRLEEVKAELAALDRKIAKLRAQLKPLEERREVVKTVIGFISGRSITTNKAVYIDRIDNTDQGKSTTIAGYAMRALRESGEWLDTRTLISVMEDMGFQSNACYLYTNIFLALRTEKLIVQTLSSLRRMVSGVYESGKQDDDKEDIS